MENESFWQRDKPGEETPEIHPQINIISEGSNTSHDDEDQESDDLHDKLIRYIKKKPH